MILFDDNNNVVGNYDMVDGAVISDNNVTWNDGSVNGINSNFGLNSGSTISGSILTDSQALELVKTTKITQLNQSCQQAIFEGFECDPNGSGNTYHYPFKSQDQTNMSQQTLRIVQGKVTQPFDWLVQDSSGNWIELKHTLSDFSNVDDTADKFKWSQIIQYRSLKNQVNQQTTISNVKSITWNPAPY